MTDRTPEISIVIPTYNERENIAAVVRDVFGIAVQRGWALEIIIVDDNSPDGTGREADRLARQFPVTVVHREAKRGLGSAVIEGLAHARGRVWGLMDGDGSHPADALPELVEPILRGEAQIVVGSRYAPGGAVEYWPAHRWMLSQLATALARLFVSVRDPLSGFLFFDRAVVEGVPLTVSGYKIGLEILIKGRYQTVREAAYTFRNREVGRSKLGWAEYLNYIQSLVSHAIYLFNHPEARQRRRSASGGAGEKAGPPADASRLWGPCPLCGADNAEFLFIKNTYRHVRCRICRLVFVNPMPTPAELSAIYENPQYFANRNEWEYGYNDYFAEKQFYTALFARRVRQCETALGAADGKGLRLLDVGCAAGFLLEAARERGWAAAGVEVSSHAVEFARRKCGPAVFHGTLHEARLPDAVFDCVVMSDILEHVGDPVGLLREAARVLKPGGVLVISAPNVHSLSARWMGRRWFHFKRDHVVLFSPATLHRAIERVGLRCFRLTRNGKMVSANYLFARLKCYWPFLGKLLLGTAGRLRLCDRLFYDSWTGEMLAFCRKASRPAKPAAAGETYGQFRTHYWPPTALWRTAECLRLSPADWTGRVLDLGCGDGFFARQMAADDGWVQWFGADHDSRTLRRSRNPLLPTRSVCAEAGRLPFSGAVFDCVLANCVLEHVGDLEGALREIARVLKPGGALIFSVPSARFHSMLRMPRLLHRIGLGRVGNSYVRLIHRLFNHRHILPLDQWASRLESVGLRLVRHEYFMPQAVFEMWERNLWWGMPVWLWRRAAGKKTGRARPRRLPEVIQRGLTAPVSEGAGVICWCEKRSESAMPPQASP
ncbi:MAG: methyltransferase domain-containing protein [Candidatus Sumerlaeia bacterium]|nr:methyltransferase domain-containing protein [Candidatus Sumerlaeia bacterium]